MIWQMMMTMFHSNELLSTQDRDTERMRKAALQQRLLMMMQMSRATM